MLFGDNAEFSVAAQSCPYLKRASNATREIWATALRAVPEDRPSNRPTRLADGLGLESNPSNVPHIAVRPVLGLIRGVGSPASDFRMEARFRLQSESAQMARLCQRHRRPIFNRSTRRARSRASSLLFSLRPQRPPVKFCLCSAVEVTIQQKLNKSWLQKAGDS